MILSFLRKNYKVVVFVFSTIFVAFVGQEVFAIYIYRRADNEDLKTVFTINGKNISLKEFNNTSSMYEDSMRRQYGLGKNVKLIVDTTKICADSIITSQVYDSIAKNLNFIVCPAEANSLLKENLYERDDAHVTEKERKKNIEEVTNRITEIQQSDAMKDSFMYVVQKSTESKNQQKVEKVFDSMYLYNDLDCENDWMQSNAKMDLEYLYVPSTFIDQQIEKKNISFEDINPDDVAINEYIKEHGYDYKKKERYRIYYFLYDYELSEDDIKANMIKVEELADRFKRTDFNERFIGMYSNKNKDSSGKKNIDTFDFDSLPDTIKSAEKIDVGEVFYDIAKTSADMNMIYKVTDVISDNSETKKYTIASVYLKPYISDATKDNMLKAVSGNVQTITEPEDMKTISGSEGRTLYDKVFEPDSKSIDNIEGGRSFIIEINKKCGDKYGEKCILRLEPRKQENNILFGFIVEHIANGTVKIDDNEDKVMENIKKDIVNINKSNLILDSLRASGVLNLPFDYIKDKIESKDGKNEIKEDCIQYNCDTVDLSHLRLKGYGLCHVKFLALLEEGDDTGFIRMNNGVIRIRVKKRYDIRKRKDISKDFYEKQKETHKKDNSLTAEQFTEIFNVENKLNNYI